MDGRAFDVQLGADLRKRAGASQQAERFQPAKVLTQALQRILLLHIAHKTLFCDHG